MTSIIQITTLILPTVAPTGAELETIADLVEHTSLEVQVSELQEKVIHIMATEVLLAPGVPGVLTCWIELSPYPTTVSPVYWGAIGGGGGGLLPLAPVLEPAIGVNNTIHTIIIPWNVHSEYARVVIQTPIAAGLPVAFWAVQVLIGGGSK